MLFFHHFLRNSNEYKETKVINNISLIYLEGDFFYMTQIETTKFLGS